MAKTKRPRTTGEEGRQDLGDRVATMGAVVGLGLIGHALVVALVVAVVLHVRPDDESGSGSPAPLSTAEVAVAEALSVKGVSITRFGARCDGKADDTAALVAAIDTIRPSGGTLRIPPRTCLIAGSDIRLGNVSIVGSGDASVLALTGGHQVMRVDGPDIRVSNLRLEHRGNVNAVIFAFRDTVASDFILDHVTMDGQATLKPEYAMGIWLEHGGEYRNIRVQDSTLTGLTYAIGIANNFAGVLDGVVVERSVFHDNFGDDVEINSPAGTARNVSVTGNTFRDNRGGYEGAGFGVGLANVGTAMISGNTFSGYLNHPIHIEDRSYDVTIEHNALGSGSMAAGGDHASYIFIVNGSHDVRINNNTIDGLANVNPTFCVYASAGGGPHGVPANITGSGNTFRSCQGYTGAQTFGDMALTDTISQ